MFPQITKLFFAALGDEKIQQKILSVLFDLLVGSKNPVCAQTINSVFKTVWEIFMLIFFFSKIHF